ncbi:MAG: LUD domain-containing protein [Anaerolineales bacterium]|nr:LUD domain-containing protein [Anaerolineales bacterium]
MSDKSKARILGNIRQALAARPQIVAAPPHVAYPDVIPLVAHPAASTAAAPLTSAPPAPLTEVFRTALEALNGRVVMLPAAQVGAWLLELARARGYPRALSWEQAYLPVPGLVAELAAGGLGVEQGALPNDPAGRAAALARWEQIRLGVTGAEAALAATGTLALRSGAGRPRLASLSVEVHVALVTPDQFYADWAAWLAALGPEAVAERLGTASNTVLISGPSRTGDIEMTLTVGVHGPREVIVMIVT